MELFSWVNADNSVSVLNIKTGRTIRYTPATWAEAESSPEGEYGQLSLFDWHEVQILDVSYREPVSLDYAEARFDWKREHERDISEVLVQAVAWTGGGC